MGSEVIWWTICGVGVALLGGLWVCVVERWRKLSLLRYWKSRNQHLHIVILCKSLVASLCNHTYAIIPRKCGIVPDQHMRGWVQSSSEHLCVLWWKFTLSAECKTDISTVLTVKNGLDPHMINLIEHELKSYYGYFLWPCWVPTISVLTLAYCCSEGKVVVEYFEDDTEF